MTGFTNDNQLAEDSSGQANWDVDLNANFDIIERGFHFQGTSGWAINSGDVCLVNSAGFVVPYDARSTGLHHPHCISWQAVNSGSNATFLLRGNLRSMGCWSGQLIPGQPVFVSAATPGFIVGSYAGISPSVGIALGSQAISFQPNWPRIIPERVTQVASIATTTVNTYVDFTLTPGYRGIVRVMSVDAHSLNNWSLAFYSSSNRNAGTLMYETVAVTTRNLNDAAMWPWLNTDTNSPALMFGRLTVNSGSGVAADTATISLEMERFR